MGRAQALAAKLEQIIVGATEDGEVDRDSVRQIVVGPGRLKDVIHVWASDSWDDYGEHDEGSAFASISNAEWLDAIDAIEATASNTVAPPPPADREAAYRIQEERRRRGVGIVHPDPNVATALDAKTAELKTDIEDALRLVATGGKLGKFVNLVGLMSRGLSISGYADLVAFYHPRGSLEFWPIHEHEEDTDVYSVGALVPEGVLMFYPEGDEDSLSSSKGKSRSRLYAFDEMRYWFKDDSDVTFRLKDALFDTTLCHGHTHEEWGRPSQEDVDAALLAHFRTRPELEFDTANPPLPADKNAWQRFVSIFVECRIARSGVLDGFANKKALDAVPKFLALLPADHPSKAGLSTGLADKLLEAGRHAEALAILDTLESKSRTREWREELDCLYALGHHEELIARVAELESESPDKIDEALPWKAMALTSLGFADDAIRFLDATPKDPSDRDAHRCAWARAHALRKSNPAGAEKALWAAFAEGHRWLEHAERDFADAASSVRGLIERRKDLETQRAVQADLLAGLERRVPAVTHAFDATSASEAATENWKLVSQAARPEKSKGSFRSLFLLGTEAVAGTGEGGFARFTLTDPSKPAHSGNFGASPDYQLSEARHVGKHLYAVGWRAGLKVFTLGGNSAKPTLVGTAGQLLDDAPNSIAAGEGFVAAATSAGAILYDLTDPASPDPVSIVATGEPGSPSVNGVAARRFHVFVTSSRGLVVADVRDRRAPRPVAFLAADGVEPQGITLFDDLAVVPTGSTVWLVDVKDPANPKSLGVLPFGARTVARAGSRLFFLNDNRQVITVDISSREKPVVTGLSRLLAADGSNQVMSYPYAVLHLDGRLLVAEEDSLMVFVREPKTAASAIADPAPKITAAEPRLVSWIGERLAEHAKTDPVFRAGALMLERWDMTLRLTLDAPRSFAGLDAGPVVEEPPTFEAELPDLLRRKGETSQITESDAPEGASDEETRRYADLSARSWEASLDRVLRAVPGTSAFKALASGRVHILSGGVLIRLVATAADPAKPWKPYRRVVPERKVRTIEEKLSDWEDLEKNIARAKAEPELKSTVLRMAADGSDIGVRIAMELPKEDEAAVFAAFDRALGAGKGGSNALEWVVERKDSLPGARPLLEALFAGVAPGSRQERIGAAKALGRCEDDVIVAFVTELLDDPDCDYSGAELAAEAMDEMERRMPELLPHLKGWVDRAGDDNRLPLIAKHLFRAGHADVPAMLHEQSEREKGDERYHSTKTGIRILDEAEWYKNDACHAERLWTGKRFADRVASLKAKGDSSAPLWAPEWEPEPHLASWNYLLRSAWPHIEKWGSLEWLVQRLASVKPGKEHAADRQIVLCVLNHYAYQNDMAKLIALAESVLRAPAGTFVGEDEDGDEVSDDDVKKKVRAQLTAARVVKGFQLGREGKFEEARALADAALAEMPRYGQALFLDARLTWLEDESPQAGIERAMKNLGKVDPHDDEGQGRLLNLIGCAYDDMKRYADAVIWFEKAAQAHRNPMYLANLAEIHEKLGDIPAAVKYAEQAKRKGAKSDLVTRLLAEHADSDDDEDEEDDLAAEIADEAFDDEESTVADLDEEDE